MKPIDFRIELNKDGCIYEPGEVISGHVLVNLGEPKAARGLKIIMQGDCTVHWTRKKSKWDRGRLPHTTVEDLKGYEKYINLTDYLVGNDQEDSNVELPVGQHCYPFSFQLPHEIPSSFEHKYGYVRYTVKAMIDRPWKFDHETTTQFTVVSQFDLKTISSAAQGIRDEDTVAFCPYCCIKVSDMDVRIMLPIRGYVPGQNINVSIHFDNRSNMAIEKIILLLHQVVNFRVCMPYIETKAVEIIVQEEKLTRPFGKDNEMMMSILVPSVPPTNLEYCKLIDIQYKLKIVLGMSTRRCNIEKTYPILIGTIPLNFVPPPLVTVPILPGAEVTNVLYPAEAGDQSIPKMNEPIPQDGQFGADMMILANSMTSILNETSSTIPPAEPDTQQIDFVISPKSPPPAYESCITEEPRKDQNKDPNSVPDKS